MNDLTALNRQLILDPAAGVADPLFETLERADPSLGALSPLARAMAMLQQTGKRRSQKARIAAFKRGLSVCWLHATTELDSQSIGAEPVQHWIDSTTCGKPVRLEFVSSGWVAFSPPEPDPAYEMSFQRLMTLPPHDLRTTIGIYRLWTEHSKATPVAYPNDRGNQIGGINSELVRIGGVNVTGPSYTNEGNGESYFAGLSDEFMQVVDQDGGGGRFCWLHYLTEEGARHLGIAGHRTATSATPVGELPRYPAWMSADTNPDETWITEGEVIQSFSEGVVMPERLTFFIGGVDGWTPPSPPDPDEEVDEDEEADEVMSSKEDTDGALGAGALFTFSIGRDQKALPRELKSIMGNIQRLVDAAKGV
jgi:hypothetical protein